MRGLWIDLHHQRAFILIPRFEPNRVSAWPVRGQDRLGVCAEDEAVSVRFYQSFRECDAFAYIVSGLDTRNMRKESRHWMIQTDGTYTLP